MPMPTPGPAPFTPMSVPQWWQRQSSPGVIPSSGLAGPQLFYSTSAVQTTVVQDLGPVLQVASVQGYPVQYPFTLLLEWGTASQEVATVTQAPTYNPGTGVYQYAGVLRGQDGTVQITHAPGAQVNHGVSARDFFQVAPVYNVCAYGADPAGVNDSTAAFQAAVNACISAGGGVVHFPPGAYKTTATVTGNVNGTAVYIQGGGNEATTIYYYGAGDCLRIYDASLFDNRVKFGGGIRGLTIDGANSSGIATGFHMGDIFHYDADFAVRNFTVSGSIGAHFDNQYYWTEQLSLQVYASNCASHVVFDVSGNNTSTGSFSRLDATIYINQSDASFNGVVLQNGADIYDGSLSIYGNFSSSSSPVSSALLYLTGTSPAGHPDAGGYSQINSCELNVGAECDSSFADTPYSIYINNPSNVIGSCGGVIDFIGPFTACNAPYAFITYVGAINNSGGVAAFLPAGSTNIADGDQVVSATTATAITGLIVAVGAFLPYQVYIYIPHTGAGTSGTFTFALSGPSINSASLDIQVLTGTTFTAHTINSSSATLYAAAPSASARLLLVQGTITFATSGTVGLTGVKTAGGSNVTVNAGSVMTLTPVVAN